MSASQGADLAAIGRGAVELFTPTRPRTGIAWLWLALTGLVLATLYVADPAVTHLFPPCPFRAATGIECPGCGTARAVHQLLHGRPLAAFRLNPLLALYAPFLVRALFASAFLAIRGRPLPPLAIRAGWIWLLLAVTLAFWVVRNTPLWP